MTNRNRKWRLSFMRDGKTHVEEYFFWKGAVKGLTRLKTTLRGEVTNCRIYKAKYPKLP